MFYVAPLFLIALLAWIERGAVRPRRLTAVAAISCALVVVVIPFDRFLTTSAITDTLMLLPFWSLQDRVGEEWVTPAAFALAAGLAAAFVFVPRRYAIVLPLLVLALWLLALRPIWWGRTVSSASRADRSTRGSARPSGTGSIVRSPKAPARLSFDGSHRPAHREPDRVLQPCCRPRVLRQHTDPRRAPRDAVRIDPRRGA